MGRNDFHETGEVYPGFDADAERVFWFPAIELRRFDKSQAANQHLWNHLAA